MHIRVGWLVLFALVGGAASLLRNKSRKAQESDTAQDTGGTRGDSAEPKAADIPKAPAKTRAAKPKAAKPNAADKPKSPKPAADKSADFSKIEGIGPKIRQILQEGGVRTFEDLASSSADDLRAILEKAGPRYRVHDPSTWPQQAGLAAAGKWDELKQLQQELKGGRKA